MELHYIGVPLFFVLRYSAYRNRFCFTAFAEPLPIGQKLAGEWLPGSVAEITTEIRFDDIAIHLKAMLKGKAKGRTPVKII
jgi:hypothetical protein